MGFNFCVFTPNLGKCSNLTHFCLDGLTHYCWDNKHMFCHDDELIASFFVWDVSPEANREQFELIPSEQSKARKQKYIRYRGIATSRCELTWLWKFPQRPGSFGEFWNAKKNPIDRMCKEQQMGKPQRLVVGLSILDS